MRYPRVVLPGYPHHVILRGNNRRKLFSYPSDYRAFLRLLTTATLRHRVRLHHFCLMQNHVHLLVTPEDARALAAWVKDFAQRYAIRRNRTRGGTGKLFEQRFKSFAITNESYLIACSAYIELNPVRAGRVLLPGFYEWSSYHLHAGDAKRSALAPAAWTPTAFYRSLGSTSATRGAGFVEWLHGLIGVTFDLPALHEKAAAEAETLSDGYPLRLERPDGSRCD
jgi:putative transposase